MCSQGVTVDICQDIIDKQKDNLKHFFDHFCCQSTWELVDRIIHHRGKIFFSGVGKSGYVSRKIVATLQSFGEIVFSLALGDLLHGDLGVVSPGDIVCLFSKSGETREVLECVAHLKSRDVFLVAITSAPYSSLSILCNQTIVLPMVEELDPFNLMPTNSTTCQMLFGDLLSMTLLRVRGVSLSEYGRNHPGGQIGLKISGKIRDYMLPRTEVPICCPEDTVSDSLEVFSMYSCGCVCVVNTKSEILGIFTDGDLRRALSLFGGDILQQQLQDVMTVNPRVVSEDADVVFGLQMMESGSPVTILPVVDAESKTHIVGLLHMHSLAKAGLV